MVTSLDRLEDMNLLSNKELTSPSTSPDHKPKPTGTAPFSCIELDRFCQKCAYNLRTLPIHRDERTGIPLVRCTECGEFQSANDAATVYRPWFHRLTSFVLVAWIIGLIVVLFWLCVAQVAMNMVTLEEQTIRAGTSIRRIGNTTIRTVRGSGPLVVWTDMPHQEYFVAATTSASFAFAFAVGLIAAVACPHWRRSAYAAFVLTTPLLIGGIATFIWRHEAAHLLGWAAPFIAAHTGAQMLGGLAGIRFGRPLARMAVLVFVPPSLRPRLAYLWMADGKTLRTGLAVA